MASSPNNTVNMENCVRHVPGKKNGSFYITDGSGYFFVKERQNRNGTISMKCRTKGCKGRAVLSEDQGELRHMTQHTDSLCTRNEEYEKAMELREKIRVRIRTEITPLSVIFNEECARYPASVSATITFKQLERTLQRDQTSINPGCPENLRGYADLLRVNAERYGLVNGCRADGSTGSTEKRLPVTCFSCRCVIGRFQSIFV